MAFGNREKILYDTQVGFAGVLDLVDIDGDNQLEVLVGSTDIHQNYYSQYFRDEIPVEIVKIDEKSYKYQVDDNLHNYGILDECIHNLVFHYQTFCYL